VHRSTHDARDKALFAAILVAAVALRLLALAPYSMHHPDEIFQYLEPAHRIAFGNGIATWEFRQGMRGWLLPTVLSWPMALGGAIAPDGKLYLLLPRLVISMMSLSIPIAAFAIGWRFSRLHAFVAMAVMAGWFEAVYFSAHGLSEQVSVVLFMPAAALMLADNQRVARNYAIAGLLLGFAVAIRFHYGPAIFVFCAMLCGKDARRRWLPLAGGAMLALALAGVADATHGAAPFSWIVANVQQNILHDQAAKFGVELPIFYLGQIGVYWRWWSPLLLLALRPAFGRNRALFATALINIALLSLIGHKEYRFILLSTTILVMLAALGSVDLMIAWCRRHDRRPGMATGILLLTLWAAASASLAASATMRPKWTFLSPELSLMSDAGRLPGLCGLALDRQVFYMTGGYSYLHRDVPLFLTYPTRKDHIADRDIGPASAAFNAVITPLATIDKMPKSFRPVSCRGDGDDGMCLLYRPGACTAGAADRWRLDVALQRNAL